MKRNHVTQLVATAAVACALSFSAAAAPAQTPNPAADSMAKADTQAQAAPERGAKQKVSGIVTSRDGDRLVVQRAGGGETVVKVTTATQITERKSNPFRHAAKYTDSQLMRGLRIEAEGPSDDSGAVVADKIRFTHSSLDVAEVVDSRSAPVESRMSSAETRLTAGEENAKHLSGEIDEVNGIANAAKTGAANAQTAANRAQDGVDANGRHITATNQRITAIDDYQPVKTATVLFKVDSAVLSDESKAELSALATQAKQSSGYVIEIAGFTSSDGNAKWNDRLSEMRASAVAHYLTRQDVEPRRIVMPVGYGDSHPVADNKTRAGRKENRRVEAKLLVSKGLTGDANAQSASSQASASDPAPMTGNATTEPASPTAPNKN